MDQSSAKPASFLYEHTMRPIALTYMPGKTAITTEDEQLLEKYIQLHDFEYHLLKKTENLYESFNAMETQLTDLNESLAKIKNSLNDTIEMADKLSANFYIPTEINLEEITEQNVAIDDEIIAYDLQFNMLYREIKYQQGIFNTCIIESEESGKMYDEYSDVSGVHNEHYLINTIDIVSLDSDFEKFRSTQNLYEERRSFFMDSCEKVLIDYSALDLKTKIIYGVRTEFLKRCESIQVVTDLRNSQIASSVN